MHKKTVAVLLALLMVILAGMTGCGKNSSDDDTEYETVNHLYFPISEIETLNPVTSTDEDTYFISRLIYDGLFSLDDTMTPVANLADKYEFEGKHIEIKLTDATFHDGKELKAKDVKFSVSAYKNAGEDSMYYPLVKNISSVKTDGEDTVIIYFKEKDNMSLDMLTFPILPSHRYDSAYSIAYNTKASFKPVGTGAYKYKSYKQEKSLKLTANEDYHGEEATNSLTFQVMTSRKYAYQLVSASSLSAMISTSASREENVTDKEQEIIDFPSNQIEYLGFNCSEEPLDKKRVRRGIACAIDNETIIQESYTNSGMTNASLYYPNYLGVNSEKDKYKYNADDASDYLEKAGYKDRDDDGDIENKDGTELTLTLLVNSDNSYRTDAAEIIEDNLEAIGIEVYVKELSEESYKTALENGDFDIFLGGLKYDETMDMREILEGEEPEITVSDEDEDDDDEEEESRSREREREDSSDSDSDDSSSSESKSSNASSSGKVTENSNFARYYSKKANKLLDDMKSGQDVEELTETYTELKELLEKDLPYYPLLQRTYGAIQSPRMEGEMSPLYDNYYNGIGELYMKYEKSQDDSDEESEDSGE